MVPEQPAGFFWRSFLFMFTSQSHMEWYAASPYEGQKHCIPMEGGLCKGLGREEGHVKREYETPYSIIASVYYSNSASEVALISSL